MTLLQLRSVVDARLADLWPRVVNRQTAFFAVHNRYWQGLYTHTIAPNTITADAVENAVAPDNLDAYPTNENSGWPAVDSFPAALCYRLRMDAWEAPDGHGFTGIIEVRHNGNLYSRQKSYPDDRYTDGWHQVTPHGA